MQFCRFQLNCYLIRTGIAADQPILQTHVATESDIESPIRIRKLNLQRNNFFVSQSTPVLKQPTKSVFIKDIAGRKHSSSSNDQPKARQFFEEEAELSLVDGSCSDDEEDSKDADGYGGSFIDDDANTPNVNET